MKRVETEIELHRAAIRLIRSTPGAITIGDVSRLRRVPATKLLADEAGTDEVTVKNTPGLWLE